MSSSARSSRYLANPICELLISKQSRLNFIVDIFFIEIPEFVLCVWNGWYSIAIITLVFWIPIDIFSYIKWVRHTDSEHDELTVVKKLSLKQDILIIAAIAVFTIVIGSLIQLIPGASESYLEALAGACGMANGILLLLRYTEQWYAWFHDACNVYCFIYRLGQLYHAHHRRRDAGQHGLRLRQMGHVYPRAQRRRVSEYGKDLSRGRSFPSTLLRNISTATAFTFYRKNDIIVTWK